jgi:hypothetical protein
MQMKVFKKALSNERRHLWKTAPPVLQVEESVWADIAQI